MRLYLTLRIFHSFADHRMLNRLPVLHPKLGHETGYSVRSENSKQIVFQRKRKPRRPFVALTAGTSSKLVVDAAAFVALGAQDMQSAQLGHLFPQHDIRPAARHVGGNGHCALLPGLGNNFGLLRMMFGIKHIVFDAKLFKELAQQFGFFDGYGSYQDGPTGFVQLANLFNRRIEFFLLRTKNQVWIIIADHRHIGGDH